TDQGGGLLVLSDALYILNSQVRRNVAATSGGIFAHVKFLMVDQCEVRGNNANHGEFGGIFAEGAEVALVRSTNFHSNEAEIGGALSASSSTDMAVINCTFLDNRAVAGVGGAMVLIATSSSITESIFSNNIAVDSGGAFHTSNGNSTTIRNCQFVNNSAVEGSGSAVWITGSELALVIGNNFSFNQALLGGGTVYWRASS
ncbi:unnamed protein product, partial [Ectocarpus fasciculatus]